MLEIKDGIIKRGKYSLKNINIKIDKGTFNIIVGKNAAGKSSLLYTIIGSILLEQGSMMKDNLKIGYVGNDLPFNQSLTGEQLLDLIGSLDLDFDKELFVKHLKEFDVSKAKRLKELSSGQKKLLMLSIELSRNVDLLILDEVSLNIDALRKEAMKDLFQNFILKGNKSIILSTNQLEGFEDISDSITYIKNNEVTYQGTVEDLVSQYSLWRGSKEEFKTLENVVAYEVREFSVEALVEDPSIGPPASLKEVLIYLERDVR